MASDRISVRLDDESRERLSEYVRESGQSESDFVREAIRKHLKEAKRVRQPRKSKPESFYDVLVREGILGGGKGMPRDLSTNPKYMEGFGQHETPTARGRKPARRAAGRRRRTP